MITINFLQTSPKPTQHPYSIWRQLFVIVSLIGSLLLGGNALARVPEDFMNKPTIIYPVENSTIPKSEFVIQGVAYNWAFVDIFIDGKPAGRAKTKNSPNGVASFFFKPASISPGTHMIQALVRSEHEVFRSPLTMSATVLIVDHPTPAPTLHTFASSGDFRRPYIRGIAKNNTTLMVYIDGKLDQQVKLYEQGKDSISFSIKPTKDLSDGFHVVKTTSTGPNGVQSKNSNIRTFLVAKQASRPVERAAGLTETPSTGFSNPKAPTLIAPKTGDVVSTTKPKIEGLAHNDLRIQTFVDGVPDQEFNVKNHPSGTARFSFLPKNDLKSGDHQIYVQAEDSAGNRSSRSNEINFLVRPEGSTQVFTPQGVSSRFYAPLVTPSTKPRSGTTGSTSAASTTLPNVQGSTDERPEPEHTNTETVVENKTIETKSSSPTYNTRKIIGWIILGISLLGIIAYVIAAALENKKNRKQKEQKKEELPKPGINFAETKTEHPDKQSEQHQNLQTNTQKSIPDLDDDIPKGYQ